MRKAGRTVISILLALTLIFGVFPNVCFAEGEESDPESCRIYVQYNHDYGEVELWTEAGDGTAVPGEEVELTYHPIEHYHVGSAVFGTEIFPGTVWYDDNDPVIDGRFIMPDHEVFIRVDFSTDDNVYKVHIEDGITHGTAAVNGTSNLFTAGETVSLTVTPERGYEVDSVERARYSQQLKKVWVQVKDNQFEMPNHDVIVRATFKEALSYRIDASPNIEEGGTVKGGGLYYKGEQATVTAEPAEGYVFESWTEDGYIMSYDPSMTFTVQRNRNLKANFRLRKTYTVSVEISPNGYGTVTGAGPCPEGESVTLKAVPKKGCQFLNWVNKLWVVSTDPEYTFTPTGDMTLTANFIDPEEVVYPLWVAGSQVTSKNLSGDGWSYDPPSQTLSLTDAAITDSCTVGYGSTVTENIFVSNMDLTISLTGQNTLSGAETAVWASACRVTFTGTGSLEASASGFVLYTYGLGVTGGSTVTAKGKVISLGGEEDNKGAVNVENGGSFTCGDLYIDGPLSVENGTFSCTEGDSRSVMARGEITISDSSFTVEATEHYGLSGTKDITVEGDSTVKVSSKANAICANYDGGKIVIGDGLGIKVPEHSSYDYQVYEYDWWANVVEIVPYYTVKASASPEEGGTVSGGGTFEKGSSLPVSLTAEAAKGYRFAGWTEKGETLSTDPNYRFNAVKSQDITAVFEQIDYPIAKQADHGTISVVKTAHYQDTVEAVVDPDPGYKLIRLTWTPEGGSENDITGTGSFDMPDAKVTVKAYFEEKPPLEKPVITVKKASGGDVPMLPDSVYYANEGVVLEIGVAGADSAIAAVSGEKKDIPISDPDAGTGSLSLTLGIGQDETKTTTVTVMATDDRNRSLISTAAIVQSTVKPTLTLEYLNEEGTVISGQEIGGISWFSLPENGDTVMLKASVTGGQALTADSCMKIEWFKADGTPAGKPGVQLGFDRDKTTVTAAFSAGDFLEGSDVIHAKVTFVVKDIAGNEAELTQDPQFSSESEVLNQLLPDLGVITLDPAEGTASAGEGIYDGDVEVSLTADPDAWAEFKDSVGRAAVTVSKNGGAPVEQPGDAGTSLMENTYRWTAGNGDEKALNTYEITAVYETVTGAVKTVAQTFTIDTRAYNVRFVNDDGTELQSGEVKYGRMPEYTGKTPEKAADEEYRYTFKGWTPGLAAAEEDAVYTAEYDRTALKKYQVISGGGGSWTRGKTGTMRFVIKATEHDEETFAHFAGVLADGRAVPERIAAGKVNYTAESGSLILDLQPAFLDTLSEGNHTVTVQFDDGKAAEAAFSVAAGSSRSGGTSGSTSGRSPRTGDSSHTVLWLVLLAAAACGIFASAFGRRKYRKNR